MIRKLLDFVNKLNCDKTNIIKEIEDNEDKLVSMENDVFDKLDNEKLKTIFEIFSMNLYSKKKVNLHELINRNINIEKVIPKRNFTLKKKKKDNIIKFKIEEKKDEANINRKINSTINDDYQIITKIKDVKILSNNSLEYNEILKNRFNFLEKNYLENFKSEKYQRFDEEFEEGILLCFINFINNDEFIEGNASVEVINKSNTVDTINIDFRNLENYFVFNGMFAFLHLKKNISTYNVLQMINLDDENKLDNLVINNNKKNLYMVVIKGPIYSEDQIKQILIKENPEILIINGKLTNDDNNFKNFSDNINKICRLKNCRFFYIPNLEDEEEDNYFFPYPLPGENLENDINIRKLSNPNLIRINNINIAFINFNFLDSFLNKSRFRINSIHSNANKSNLFLKQYMNQRNLYPYPNVDDLPFNMMYLESLNFKEEEVPDLILTYSNKVNIPIKNNKTFLYVLSNNENENNKNEKKNEEKKEKEDDNKIPDLKYDIIYYNEKYNTYDFNSKKCIPIKVNKDNNNLFPF